MLGPFGASGGLAAFAPSQHLPLTAYSATLPHANAATILQLQIHSWLLLANIGGPGRRIGAVSEAAPSQSRTRNVAIMYQILPAMPALPAGCSAVTADVRSMVDLRLKSANVNANANT